MKIICVALSVGIIGACTPAATPPSMLPGCVHTARGLIDLGKVPVYRDAMLSQKETSEASHAILIGGNLGSFRLLRIDGKVVWASEIKKCTPLVISGSADKISVSTRPLSDEGDDPAFEWREIQPDASLKIVGSSDEAYPMSPEHLRTQGRILPSATADLSLSWPQLQITTKQTIVWATPEELQFRSPMPLDVYGLLQRPFTTLTTMHSTDALSGQKISFKDFTDSTVSMEQTLIQNANLAQMIIPQRSTPEIPVRISLHTTPENCSLIQSVWSTGAVDYFGYCKHGTTGPTPYIVGYQVPETGNFIDLDVLEVFGDEAESVRFRLSIADGNINVSHLGM